MSSPSTARPPRWLGPAIYLGVILLGVGFAIWAGGQQEEAAPPSDVVLLDQRTPLRSDGTEFAFTVRQPSRLRIQVNLPEGLKGTVRVGVPGIAKKRAFAYRPLRESELTFRVDGAMDEPFERDVMAVGGYILRLDPIPVAMGEMRAMIHAYVTAEPIIGR